MKKNGCLTWIIGFFVVCLLIGLYSLAWIPAIGFIIYYLIKKLKKIILEQEREIL